MGHLYECVEANSGHILFKFFWANEVESLHNSGHFGNFCIRIHESRVKSVQSL